MVLPVVLLLEACFTLPALAPFLTAPGCRPGTFAVVFVLSAVTPLLLGLRLLVGKKPVPRWLWAAVPLCAWAAVVPAQHACVPPA